MTIPQPVITGLFTLGGVILGGLINPLLSYLLGEKSKRIDRELAERQRQLELYKTVYPEKVKMAVSLMEQAAKVTKSIGQIEFVLGESKEHQPQVEHILSHLMNDIRTFQQSSQSCFWLLGGEVGKKALQLGALTAAYNNKRVTGDRQLDDKDVTQINQSFKNLADAVHQHLNISAFDQTFAIEGNTALVFAKQDKRSIPPSESQ